MRAIFASLSPRWSGSSYGYSLLRQAKPEKSARVSLMTFKEIVQFLKHQGSFLSMNQSSNTLKLRTNALKNIEYDVIIENMMIDESSSSTSFVTTLKNSVTKQESCWMVESFDRRTQVRHLLA
jgi:hypothetical protein